MDVAANACHTSVFRVKNYCNSVTNLSLFGTYPAKQSYHEFNNHLHRSAERTMSYRTFLDSTGRRWEVWLVTPAAAERRKADRRAAAGSGPEGTSERRLTPDRRRGSFRRSVTVAGEFSNGWLCFESEGEKRRLVPIPEGWTEMGPDRLSSLLQAAKRVVKCGP